MAEATLTLTDFLLARIAEDEAVAQGGGGWVDSPLQAAYDPARVLAECAAKRQIVTAHGCDSIGST